MLAARTLRTSSLVLPRAIAASSPRPAVALFSTHSARLRPHPQATYSDKGAMTGHLDTYSEVIVDHNNVKQLFHMYKKATSKEEKGTLVNTIIREIAVHSEAEEVSVYNDLESRGLAGESKELRDEHEQLEKVLYSVDWTKVDSSEFEPKFEHAIQLFIKHSDREEEDILKRLKEKLTPEENDKLAQDFLMKRKAVPERPHPLAPQSGGIVQKVAGALTKPHDKILETLRGQHFLSDDQLAYKHGQSTNVQPIKIDTSLLTHAFDERTPRPTKRRTLQCLLSSVQRAVLSPCFLLYPAASQGWVRGLHQFGADEEESRRTTTALEGSDGYDRLLRGSIVLAHLRLPARGSQLALTSLYSAHMTPTLPLELQLRILELAMPPLIRRNLEERVRFCKAFSLVHRDWTETAQRELHEHLTVTYHKPAVLDMAARDRIAAAKQGGWPLKRVDIWLSKSIGERGWRKAEDPADLGALEEMWITLSTEEFASLGVTSLKRLHSYRDCDRYLWDLSEHVPSGLTYLALHGVNLDFLGPPVTFGDNLDTLLLDNVQLEDWGLILSRKNKLRVLCMNRDFPTFDETISFMPRLQHFALAIEDVSGFLDNFPWEAEHLFVPPTLRSLTFLCTKDIPGLRHMAREACKACGARFRYRILSPRGSKGWDMEEWAYSIGA
uniref:BY PROTMAP: gi/342319008/gb/EGU10960.1/ Proteophosphoglycan 5 [Rhodotorula glutinis ATCC 204091] n=3 Tax=Rhodotorula toruloides TaxID=5286 RepID=A0A0K3CU05_RHOTO